MSCDRLTVTWEVSTIAWIPLLPSNGLSKAMISISRPVGKKNTQVVTSRQTSCYKYVKQAVNKLCSHCLFPVVATNLDQAVNNL